MAFLAGKDGRASFAGTAYKITRWQADETNQVLDVTNGESGGEGENIAGVNDVKWEVDMDYYTGNSPYATGKLNPGQTGILILYHTAGGDNWTITAIVEDSREELEVRGRVRVYARGNGTVISTQAVPINGWWSKPEEGPPA